MTLTAHDCWQFYLQYFGPQSVHRRHTLSTFWLLCMRMVSVNWITCLLQYSRNERIVYCRFEGQTTQVNIGTLNNPSTPTVIQYGNHANNYFKRINEYAAVWSSKLHSNTIHPLTLIQLNSDRKHAAGIRNTGTPVKAAFPSRTILGQMNGIYQTSSQHRLLNSRWEWRFAEIGYTFDFYCILFVRLQVLNDVWRRSGIFRTSHIPVCITQQHKTCCLLSTLTSEVQTFDILFQITAWPALDNRLLKNTHQGPLCLLRCYWF